MRKTKSVSLLLLVGAVLLVVGLTNPAGSSEEPTVAFCAGGITVWVTESQAYAPPPPGATESATPGECETVAGSPNSPTPYQQGVKAGLKD